MMRTSIPYFAVSAAAALVLNGSDVSVAATTNANAAAPQTVQLTASSKVAQLLTLPDATILLGPGGQRSSVGQVRALDAARVARFDQLKHGDAHGAIIVAKRAVPERLVQARSEALAFAATRQSLGVGSPVSGSMGTLGATPAPSPTPKSAASRPVGIPTRGPNARPTLEPATPAPVHTYNPAITTAVMNYCPLDAHVIQTVNLKKTGVPFTPGGYYSIAGCGFGTAGGTASLHSPSGATIPLTVTGGGWDADRVFVQLPADFGGIEDQPDVTLTVVPNGKAAITSGPDRFVAVRATVPLQINGQIATNIFNGDSWPGQPFISQDATTFNVQRGMFVDGYCPQPGSSRTDTWHMNNIALPDSQWYIEDATVTNTTPQWTTDDDSQQDVLTAPMTVAWNGDALAVKHQMLSVYWKKHLGFFGDSECSSSYTVTLLVNGPRGVTPIAK